MTASNSDGVQLATVAEFPEGSFLENLLVLGDGSILITVLSSRELWRVPAPGPGLRTQPELLHTFERMPMGLVEREPNEVYVVTCEGYTTHEGSLERVDLRVEDEVRVDRLLEFPSETRALNGACSISRDVLLVADSMAGLVWRVDLAGSSAEARVWLRHESMALDPDNRLEPPQPGVNGIRFDARTGFVYYTSTQRKLFMRVALDSGTLEPRGEPELVSSGTMADDFVIDEQAGVAYVTTHRENTLDRIVLQASTVVPPRDSVVGNPFDPRLVGPSSAAWGPRPEDIGRLLYVTTDGGTTSKPPDGVVRSAKLVRVMLPQDERQRDGEDDA